MYLGDFKEDSMLHFGFSTRSAAGASITFAGTPAVAVFADGGSTPITAGVTLTVDVNSVTGRHHVAIDLSASASYATATDFEVVVTSGTVDSQSVVGQVLANFSILNRAASDVATQCGVALVAAGLDGVPATVAEILTDTGTTLPATLATLATASALSTVSTNVSTIISTIGTPNEGTVILDLDEILADTQLIRALALKLDPMLELDSTVYRFTANALEQAPSGGGGGDATAANQATIISMLNTIDSNVDAVLVDTGTTLQDDITNIKNNVIQIVTYTGVDIPGALFSIYTDTQTLVAGGGGATAGEIADAVCDELLADHTTIGSVGAALAAASASGDPWATVLGGYGADTAGDALNRLLLTPPDAPVLVTPDPAGTADMVNVYLHSEDITGTVLQGLVVRFQLVAVPTEGSSGRFLSSTPMSAVTDENGMLTIALDSGKQYIAQCSALFGRDGLTFTPTGDTYNLTSALP